MTLRLPRLIKLEAAPVTLMTQMPPPVLLNHDRWRLMSATEKAFQEVVSAFHQRKLAEAARAIYRHCSSPSGRSSSAQTIRMRAGKADTEVSELHRARYDLGTLVDSLPEDQKSELTIALIDSFQNGVPENLAAVPGQKLLLIADNQRAIAGSGGFGYDLEERIQVYEICQNLSLQNERREMPFRQRKWNPLQ